MAEMFAPRTWDDLRAETVKRLRYKWRYASAEDIEDAAGDATLRVLDYWTDLASTRKVIESGDAPKLWNYACQYAYHYGTELLVKRAERAESVVSIVASEDEAHDGYRCVSVESLEPCDSRTDDEREDAMLARLFDKYGAPAVPPGLGGLAERVTSS
jgi:hypothetical protein